MSFAWTKEELLSDDAAVAEVAWGSLCRRTQSLHLGEQALGTGDEQGFTVERAGSGLQHYLGHHSP